MNLGQNFVKYFTHFSGNVVSGKNAFEIYLRFENTNSRQLKLSIALEAQTCLYLTTSKCQQKQRVL